MRRPAALLALVLAASPAGAEVQVVPIATGLARPTFVTSAPGDQSRLFFLEQHTRNVRIFDVATGSVLPDPFLTVPSGLNGGEEGLLGLAFHPDYAENGRFFVNRTNASGNIAIERYEVSAADPNLALAAPTPILSIAHPQTNHNGGWLGFGPDGYLYASTGDGGGANDTGNGHTAGTGNAQDISDNLLGKMLRIDVDSAPLPGLGYAVPADNPFVGAEGDDLIWAYGLRNPWRASFDRQTGDLWIGDVGQGLVEEIDFQPAGSAGGENYGWRLREGTGQTPGAVGGAKPPGAIDPVHQYTHTGPIVSRSVVGGYVYRGPIAELQGQYFFADTIQNRVWSITFDGSDPSEFDGANFVSFKEWTEILDPTRASFRTISSFGEDELGNLYIVALGSGTDGAIYRIVPEPGTGLLVAAGLALGAWSQKITPRSRSAARRAAS